MTSLKFKEILCLLYSALLFLSGAILIGVAIVLTFKLSTHFTFTPTDTLGPFIVIFVLGFVHLLLTWLGIRGPQREHDFHIIMFIVITVMLFLIEFTVGIWSMVIWSEVEAESNQLMTESFGQFIANGDDRKQWVRLQTKLHCCAILGKEDYTKKPISAQLVATCPENYLSEGCKNPLQKRVKSLMIDAAIINFTSGVFQILGVAIFFIFLRSLKQEREARAAHIATLRRQASNAHNPQAPPQQIIIPPQHSQPAETAPPTA